MFLHCLYMSKNQLLLIPERMFNQFIHIMAKETLKKMLACAFVALIASNMNITANAQENILAGFDPAGITAQAKSQLDSMKVVEEATKSRFHYFQKSDGTMARVWVDNPEIWKPKWGVGGGYTISNLQQAPIAMLSLYWDGCGVGRKEFQGEDGKWYAAPRMRLAAGLDLQFSPGKYLPSAYSAGQRYFVYEAFGHVDIPIVEDNLRGRHRLDGVLGVGYSYTQHDKRLADYGKIELEDGMPTGQLDLNDNGNVERPIVDHWGSMPFAGAGLAYSWRFNKAWASRLRICILGYWKPMVQINEKLQSGWGGQITVQMLVGGRYNHQAPKK